MSTEHDLIASLKAIVGPDHVLAGTDLIASYETDWTRRFHGCASAVVRPATTAEVAAVLAWCNADGQPVVPQGGNTGLVGGAVPHDGAVVLSTARVDGIGPLDDTAGQVTVGAGATLGSLIAHLDGSRWAAPVDLAARDSATIGGMVATNAGGTRVVRHGMMRRNVAGLEAVLADGAVVGSLRGLEKDNTGYDLASLFTGSEGTLGVIVSVRLRLVPAWPERCAVWMACEGWHDATSLASRLRTEVEGLDALEAVDAACLDIVGQHGSLAAVLPGPRPPVALLAEWAGRGDVPRALVDAASERDHAVAGDGSAVDAFWAWRDRVTEAIAAIGVPHKLDVTLPVSRLGEFTDALGPVTAPHRLFLFGHLGDGNLHVNVVGPPDDDTLADERVLALVAAMGGSISAEHGIGRAKREYLHLSRSEADIATFRRVKAALDPAGILNPGVLLPPPG